MANTRIKLVVFDMDGTLTMPILNFAKIRADIGMPIEFSGLTLDYIKTLTDETARKRAFAILEHYEDVAANEAGLQPGAKKTLQTLSDWGLRTALLTRNSQRAVDIVLGKHSLQFEDIFTRENAPPKPDPAAINTLIKKYSLERDEVVMVGDLWPDVETGINAGVATVLIENPMLPNTRSQPDEQIDSLPELLDILRKWS
jgi:HAD superfamily hydrolase (TIGR01509 family)